MTDNCPKTTDLQLDASQEIFLIDLKIDYCFKLIFGTEGNEDLLLILVNYLLPEKHIKSVRLGPQEQKGEYEKSRDCIFDVYCTTDDGSKLVIEIQRNKKNDFAKRMVYYSGFPIRSQVQSGAKVYDYNSVYVIGILDFLLPSEMATNNMINTFTFRNDMEHDIQFTPSSILVTVELPKYRKALSEVETLGEKLMYCIRHQESFTEIPEELQCPELEKLFGISNFASLSENQQNMYMREFKEMLDRQSELNTAETNGIEKGIAEGRAEGRAEGQAEGRAKGLEEGREAERLRTAKEMKAKHFPIDVIAEITTLSAEQIELL